MVSLTRPHPAPLIKNPPGIEYHHLHLPWRQVERDDGLVRTILPRTAVDLARTLPFRDAVAVVDNALYRRRTNRASKDRLRSIIQDGPSRTPGNPQALKVIAFATHLADSPLESAARVLMYEQGLPRPDLQRRIEHGGFWCHPDFHWGPPYWTIAETDGRLKYKTEGDLWKEKRREDAIREIGYEVVRITWAQVLHDTGQLRERLLRAFARGKARHGGRGDVT